MTIERVVVDTNVLISAALRPKGAPGAVLDSIRSMNGVLIFSDDTFSDDTFSELQSRFNCPKFDRYVSQDLRRIWLSQLEAVSEWVSITGVRIGCRDPDDDKVLETALIGDVSCLVTGDHDLLMIPQPPRKVSILTPSAFLMLAFCIRINSGHSLTFGERDQQQPASSAHSLRIGPPYVQEGGARALGNMIEQDHHVQAVDLRYSVLEFIDIPRSHTGTGIFATTIHDWHVEFAQLKSA